MNVALAAKKTFVPAGVFWILPENVRLTATLNFTDGMPSMGNSELTFANLLNAFNKLYRQRGKDLETQCPNAAAHNHGDRKPSCKCIEAADSDTGKGGFHCLACGIHGTAWDFAGWLCGFDGYPGHEVQIRDRLIELEVISSDSKYSQHTQTAFPERAVWFCLYPGILEKIQQVLSLRESPLKESLLLSTLVYYVRLNGSKTGRDYWNCSMKKVREKFLPFFSESTLLRSVNRLQDAGMISTFTDHRKTVWRVHFDTLHETLQSRSFPLLVGNSLQTEGAKQSKESTNSGEIVKSADVISKPVENSEKPPEKKEKKETLLTNSSIPTVDIPVVEHLGLQTEGQSLHTEGSEGTTNVLSTSEISALKKYSNDFENDAAILSKFKEVFGGSLINFRAADKSEEKPSPENSATDSCYCCGGTEFYGHRICARCHPPVGVKR